jgi:pyruvate formate lyase activating enzyme
VKGKIFNIQHFSLHDGPGVRTTVFFKGCPLKCVWCHNPEGITGSVQTFYDDGKCIRCGYCGGFHDEKTAQICPSSAIEVIGRDISPKELMVELLSDKEFFASSGGGVTFSGGEPLIQPEFLKTMLELCAQNKIHTAVDTSGFAPKENFAAINDLTDLYLFDLKLLDDELHKKYTEVSNRLILSNLKYLSEAGKRIFIRIPLIPGITDTVENIEAITGFLKNIKFEQINLLSYHGYAKNKYIKLGLDFGMNGAENARSRTEEISLILKREGYKTVTGG